MTDDLIGLLRRTPLFADLDGDALRLLAGRCQRHAFPARWTLIYQDRPGDALYLIVAGRVRVEKITPSLSAVHLATRGPGDHFGEMALLDEKPRVANVTTETECDLLVLRREDFLRCLVTSPELALGIIGSLVTRLRQAAEQSATSETLDVMGRLAVFLLEAASNGIKEPDGSGIRLARVTDEEIAERIGATRESVNRRLSRLKDMGIVRRAGRDLVVVKRQKLRDLCGE